MNGLAITAIILSLATVPLNIATLLVLRRTRRWLLREGQGE